jgi:uncharacterized protein YaiL (DUF2058 family)
MSKQKLSLQDQLLKAGLANSAQAKKVQAEKRKQGKMQRNNNLQPSDDARVATLKAQAEKAEKDRLLNEQRKQHDAQQAIHAQIKQLLDNHRLPQAADGVAYRFIDGSKVKTLYVAENLRQQLVMGRAAVIKFANDYAIVNADIAEKIAQRDVQCVLVAHSPEKPAVAADDPYAAYQVPDDLMW